VGIQRRLLVAGLLLQTFHESLNVGIALYGQVDLALVLIGRLLELGSVD
jgi:hypothetical protein